MRLQLVTCGILGQSSEFFKYYLKNSELQALFFMLKKKIRNEIHLLRFMSSYSFLQKGRQKNPINALITINPKIFMIYLYSVQLI